MSAQPQALARRLWRQALACQRSGSPLYGTLLERLAADTEAGGPGLELLQGHERDPPGSALALRSFLWPDQKRRLRRLERALEVARSLPVSGPRANSQMDSPG